MNRDNPTLRWLVWPVALVVLGPFMYGLLFHDGYGVFSILTGGRAARLWPWMLLLVAYLVPVIVLLRWKRLVIAFELLTLLGLVQMVSASGLPERPKTVRIQFGNHHYGSDVDVYCNDIFLGKTPFKMTGAEFKSKVPPWTRPPEQPVVSYFAKEDGTPQEKDKRWWYWTWTPGDPFEWPTDFTAHQRYNDPEKLAAFLKVAPYWFRFEKDDCLTLRKMDGFSGGGGGLHIIDLQVDLNVTVQAQQRMKELVMAGLRAFGYKPSPEWTAFVLKYRDELLNELIQDSATDKQLADVLDQMADAHFQLPVNANRAESRQALDRTFDSVSRREEDDFRWFAGRTAVRIVKKFPDLLAERTRKEVGSAPDRWNANYHADVRRRRELLLDLLSEVYPAELFDLVVYLHGLGQQHYFGSRDPRLMMAIGNSGRSEAVPLLRQYLREIWNKTDIEPGFSDDQEREASIRMMAKVFHPELEDEFWNHVSHVKPDHFNKFGPIPKFIQSRIDRGENLEGLVHRIQNCTSLTEDQRGPLLAQIGHPAAGVWLSVEGNRLGDYQRDELMNEVCKLPANPALAQFLVDSWMRSHKLQPGYIHPTWNLAILRMDTPEVREFVLARLKEDDPPGQFRQWHKLTDLPDPAVPGRLEKLNWLVPELRKTTDYRRDASVPLLLEIATPDAMALLHEWAGDVQSGVSKHAARVLQQPTEQETERQKKNAEQLVKVNDLLSGRTKPDALLPPYPSAKWTGEVYEAVPAQKVKETK